VTPGGLLVITAHPDDEAIIAGGVLAATAAAGVATSVVCLTRGELGGVSDPQLLAGRTLAQARRDELHEACDALGVRSVRCLRRADGYLPFVRRGELVAQIARLVRAERPAAVLTFGEDGLYYHPDHVAVHELTRAAMERLWQEDDADPGAPVLYEAVWPSRVTVAAAQALARRDLPCELWGIPPEDFGVDELTGAVRIEVRAFVAAKLRALRCHRTQIGPDHLFARMPAALARRYLAHEWFRPRAPAHADTGWLSRTATAGVPRG